jgi:hypothetical protein
MKSFLVADLIIARVKVTDRKSDNEIIESIAKVEKIPAASIDSTNMPTHADGLKQKIRGTVSVNSYSDNSGTNTSKSQRFRYTFSLDARNIANSKLSLESYLSFRHKAGEWEEVKNNVFNALKIFSLAVKYDLNKTTQISLGRKINPRISSVGAIDGLQFEKSLNRFSMGAFIGTRPDYLNYSFNIRLLQYGTYVAYNTKTQNSYSESSLALIQQTNNSKTDRRFIYFQHSNSLINNLSFFTTLEADLYQLKGDSLTSKAQNTLNLTGLYLSLSYKPGKKLTLYGSYDARKNIIYYETYKTFVDRILENELRQGFRVQVNYRITRDIMFGLQTGYRFLKSDPHRSENINGYLTYNQIPALNISSTISATYLLSGYINGKIFSLNFSRDFFRSKVQTGIGYRYVDYTLPENILDIHQDVGEVSLSWQPVKNLSLSVSYEGTFEERDKYNRLYLQVRKRF